MKYYIRTTKERSLHSSYSQLEYELLVDTEHKPVESFIKQVKYLSTLNEDVVILEDDLVLCRNFKYRLEEIVKEHKNQVITFFYNPFGYMKSGIIDFFIWHQCVYYPKEILRYLSDNIEIINDATHLKHYDMLVFATLKHTFEYYCYRPCLVQHLDFNTLIQKKTSNRNTPYFIDYLEDLNILYENAKEHKQELIEHMHNHLAFIKKEMDTNG